VHHFTFDKSGYASYEIDLTPTEELYPIVLGGGSTSNVISECSKGVRQTILPSADFLLKNNLYNFSYGLTTTYWTFDSFGIVLRYSNGTVISTQTSSDDTGGTLSLSNFNVSNGTQIFMDYYYSVNGSVCGNSTRFWTLNTENEFSIWYFFQDLGTYIDADMYGILGDDNGQFSKALIASLIIILVVGGLVMRYGIQNEAVIMGMITGILLFLNTINLLPSPSFFTNSPVSFGDFLVYITLVITIGFIIKEEQR